jgi:sugar phosphate isomerase/epimerase
MANEGSNDERGELLDIAKAGYMASELTAELNDLKDSTDIVVITRIVDDDGLRIGSLSTLDGPSHLEVMIEATQRFAKQIGVDLHMVYGGGAVGGQG